LSKSNNKIDEHNTSCILHTDTPSKEESNACSMEKIQLIG